MPKIQSIASFPPDVVDLLEAVGYMDTGELCSANKLELLEELVKANEALRITETAPTGDLLTQWQAWARSAMGEVEAAGDDDVAQAEQPESESAGAPDLQGETDLNEDVEFSGTASENFEDDSDVQSMLEVSPEADLIPAELIKRHSLSVSKIPKGILLSECSGDVEMKVMTTQNLLRHQLQTSEAKRSGLMTSRIRSFSDHDSNEHHVKPLQKGEQREIVSLSEGLNAGLSPDSRRFVRGVLHPDPTSVRVSAFFAVLVQVMLAVNLIGVPALIIYDQLQVFPDAVWWIVGLVSSLFLSALCYLFWGLAARCRVCGQRQFSPKKCLKNRKAHHIPLIGYIFPTALHAMFFKWFYCTYCGTAVRLKK